LYGFRATIIAKQYYIDGGFRETRLEPIKDSSDSDVNEDVLDLKEMRPKVKAERNDREKEAIETNEVSIILFQF
jgi:hypothetical protein